MADSYEASETDEQVAAENVKTFKECAALVEPIYRHLRTLTDKPATAAAAMLLTASFITRTLNLTHEQSVALITTFLLKPLAMPMPNVAEAIRKATETAPQ